MIDTLIAAGDQGGAAGTFLRSVGLPGVAVRILALLSPRKIKTVAHTLPYDLRLLGDTGRGVPLDPARRSGVAVPAIVLDGGRSPRYMRHAARVLREALPQADYRTLPGQTPIVKAPALAPAVQDFLRG